MLMLAARSGVTLRTLSDRLIVSIDFNAFLPELSSDYHFRDEE